VHAPICEEVGMVDSSVERMAMKPPTLYDVARLAEVSHQTVSRVVKGHTNIGPDIRERVEAAISALDYKPNMAARSLATNRSQRIGALVYEIVEVGPNKIMQGASDAAREAGYLLDIVTLDPTSDLAIQQAVSLINQQMLAGILVFAPTDRVLAAVRHARFAIPVFVETDAPAGTGAPTLNEQGVGLLVDHLVELGHRRFFHIAGPADWLAARNRESAFEAGMRRHGVHSVATVRGNWTSQSGYAAGMSMPLDQGITAVVAANDQQALGAIAALSERSVRVPEDVSVVGFDDIPEARFFRPALTTVSVDFDRQGRAAFDRLLEMIRGDAAVADHPAARPQLFLRASSAPAAR
jgi:DNA-binding LacI/PurR family transcriptional regulator